MKPTGLSVRNRSNHYFCSLFSETSHHSLYSNLKSNEQDKKKTQLVEHPDSSSIFSSVAVSLAETKAELIFAKVVDTVEFALICGFHGSVGLTSEIHSEMKLLHYT